MGGALAHKSEGHRIKVENGSCIGLAGFCVTPGWLAPEEPLDARAANTQGHIADKARNLRRERAVDVIAGSFLLNGLNYARYQPQIP